MGNNFDDFEDFEGFDDFEDNSIKAEGFGDNTFEDSNMFEENSEDDNETEDGYSSKKTAIVCIIVGILLVVGVLVFNSVYKNTSARTENPVVDSNTTVAENNANVVIDTSKYTDEWRQFTSDSEIIFNPKYIDSMFTITSISNSVKIVDSESNLMVKTILKGSLSGFIGTYELELPYSKGSKLLIGNNFNVKVQLGEYKGKKVVGDIVY